MIKQKYFGLIAAAAALVVLAGGYAGLSYYNNIKESEDAAQTDAGVSIAMPDFDSISSIQLSNENTSFTLTKSDESWICVQDKSFPLSDSLSDEFVSAFTGMGAVRELGAAANDEDYGFGTASPSVTVTTAEDAACTLILGDANDMTGDYYMKREDTGKVYTIDSNAAEAFQKTLYDLAEIESLPSVSSENVKSLSILEDGRTLTFTSSVTGSVTTWQVKESIAPQNADAVSSQKAAVSSAATLVDGLGNLSFDRLADSKEDNLEKYGLKNPSLTITVSYTSSSETSEEEQFTLYAGDQTEDGSYYVKLAGSSNIYTMSSDLLSSFQGLSIDDYLEEAEAETTS